MFVSFTFIPSTLDERKTLTKISTRKTSHNRSPKLAHTSDVKETGRKPSLKRQTTGYTEKSHLQSPRETPVPEETPLAIASSSKAVSPTETTHQGERDLETALGVVKCIHV